MKSYLILAVGAMLIVASCKKDHDGKSKCTPPVRKVRFELYTPDNFAGDRRNITFTLIMNTSRRRIYDSSLATMKLEEIPDFAHRIIIEKTVPGNDTSALSVGFVNYFENVGSAWHLEDFPAGDTYKVVVWPFR